MDTKTSGIAVKDRSHINLNEPAEVRYWRQALQVNEDQLRATIAAVGNSVAEVRLRMGLHRRRGAH